MDIYLTDLSTNDRLRFPMLPQEIQAKIENQFYDYSIISIGEIKLPSGSSLDGFSWNGTLPGKARKREPYVREWRDPQAIYKWLEGLKSQRGVFKKLRLLITQTPVNYDVFLENFTGKPISGYGDIQYQINFIQARDLKISLAKNTGNQTAPPLQNTPPKERPAPPPAKTHTVVSGDTLWGIAQKYYGNGAQYGKIYDANRETIEAEANKRRGGRGSNNGHWIYPGTVLTIP